MLNSCGLGVSWIYSSTGPARKWALVSSHCRLFVLWLCFLYSCCGTRVGIISWISFIFFPRRIALRFHSLRLTRFHCNFTVCNHMPSSFHDHSAPNNVIWMHDSYMEIFSRPKIIWMAFTWLRLNSLSIHLQGLKDYFRPERGYRCTNTFWPPSVFVYYNNIPYYS